MQPLSTIIFDFDGTLADSMLQALPAYNRVADRLALPRVTREDIPKLRRLGAMKAFEAYGVPLWRVPQLLSNVRRELESTGQVPTPFPDLLEALTGQRMRSARTMILSSNSRANISRFLEANPLLSFERINCGTSFFSKGRRLRRLLEVSRLLPSNVAYVGDEVRDIEAARDVGATSISVTWGFADRDELQLGEPDHLVDTPKELGELLERLLGREERR